VQLTKALGARSSSVNTVISFTKPTFLTLDQALTLLLGIIVPPPRFLEIAKEAR